MKFIADYNNEKEHGVLLYLKEEFSFYMGSVINEIDFYIEINYVQITFSSGRVSNIDGFCPYGTWIKKNISVPDFHSGRVYVEDEPFPGFCYGVNDTDWPVYVDIETGWVCIGNPAKKEEAIEFIDNCVAVLENKEIVALWLKPKSLPEL